MFEMFYDVCKQAQKVAAADHFAEANAVDFSKLDDYLVSCQAVILRATVAA